MRAGHVSKGEQTSFSQFLQAKSSSLEAEVNAETSSRIVRVELFARYSLMAGIVLN